MPAARRLALLVAVAVAGWLTARVLGTHDLTRSHGYLLVATGLLAVGLFSATHGISRHEVRGHVRTVLAAVTLGVLAKAAIIGGLMYLVYPKPTSLILGLALAQIDPLSVAAMSRDSRMSGRARAILSAWASFDDPVTTLLTVYLSAWVLWRSGGSAGVASGGDGLSVLVSLAWNAAFAAVAYLIWRAARSARARLDRLREPWRSWALRAGRVAIVLVLLALLAVAMVNFLMLGVAAIGLFFRPAIAKAITLATDVAFVSATFAVGLLLTDGVHLVAGLVLGAAAYGAQIVVGLLLGRSLPVRDRGYLAFGQQNGITAIILALLLERSFPGTVAVVAPAILTVALLYVTANAGWDRRFPEPAGAIGAPKGGDRFRLRRDVGPSGRAGDPAPDGAPAPDGVPRPGRVSQRRRADGGSGRGRVDRRQHRPAYPRT